MDELVQKISEETGLSEEQARKAAEVVVNFLKEKLPAPLAGQIDNLIENPALLDNAENLLNLGKNFFNKKD